MLTHGLHEFSSWLKIYTWNKNLNLFNFTGSHYFVTIEHKINDSKKK